MLEMLNSNFLENSRQKKWILWAQYLSLFELVNQVYVL
jgi:hypothetical protein